VAAVTVPALHGPETVSLALGADSPWFAGHFPGHPILPGIAQLALVERALVALLDAPVRIAAVPSLRLRRPLGPGDALVLRLAPAEGGAVRFEIAHGAQRASHGTVGFAPDPGTLPAGTDPPPDAGVTAPAPDDAATLLPHALPARLIEAIGDHQPERLTARARIPPDSPFAEARIAPALVALELAAQAAAALEAVERAARGEGGGARRGYLVGARDARWAPPLLPVGVPLAVRVALEARALPLSHYRFEVAFAGTVVATGTIATFLGDSNR
jgi:3-hydroxymyristoyl/3-hydroxydecanoyl-(acyl carrier protein) dehydratase